MSFYDQFLLWELKQGYWEPYFKVFNDEIQRLSEDFCLYYPLVTEEMLIREGLKDDFPDLIVGVNELSWGLEKTYEDCLAVEEWFEEKGWKSIFGGWLKTNEGWVATYSLRGPFLGRSLDPRTLTLDLFRQYYWETYGIDIKYEFSEVEMGSYFFRRMLSVYPRILGLNAALEGLRWFLWSTGSDAIIYKIYAHTEKLYFNYEDWVLVSAVDIERQLELEANGYVSIPAIAISLDVLSKVAVSVDDVKTVLLSRIIPVTVSVYWIVNGSFYIDGMEVKLKEEDHLDRVLVSNLSVESVCLGRKVYDIMEDGAEVPYQLRRKLDDELIFDVLELK